MDQYNEIGARLRELRETSDYTIEELAKELEACAEESAKLDEKMLQIRDRIARD